MSSAIYLSTNHIIRIHDRILDLSHGMQGIRDASILDSIPDSLQQYLFYKPEATIYELAGVILDKVIHLHAFSDGNKRTAYGVMKTFLAMNGIKFKCTQNDALALVVDVATHKLHGDALTKFIMDRCTQ